MNGFQKFICVVDGHEKIDIITTCLALALFWPFFHMGWIKKEPEPKKLLKQKTSFFMTVNYGKEFLKSLHTGLQMATTIPGVEIFS